MLHKRLSSSPGFRASLAAAAAIALASLGGGIFAAQDKYTLRVPDGLSFSDFKGYENWQVVSVSQNSY